MKRKLAILVVFLLYAGTFLLPMSIAWQANGDPVCTNSYPQENPKICSDGAGGAIIAWLDYRNGGFHDIYAQRIDATGQKRWAAADILICNVTQEEGNIQMCSDGFGGAILTWEDYRDFNKDIYAQRVDSAGNCLWDFNGVPIVTVSNYQDNPKLCSDGAGGAIIVWVDLRPNSNREDIYAQRITASGDLEWAPNGIAVCSAAGFQRGPQIIAAGAGGAIICWYDNRSYQDIYAQKLDSAGVPQWRANGTVISNATNIQTGPQLCSDGSSGAIITWQDFRNGLGDANIYAQRITSAGTAQWGNGTSICNSSNTQTSPQICSDNAGGGIICWYDFRSGGDFDVYAQRITQTKQIVWDLNGIVICNATDNQNYPLICSDGANGAIIAWQDSRTDLAGDIYAQRVSASGEYLWEFNGAVVRNQTSEDTNQALTNAGPGAAIFTWQDDRNTPGKNGKNYDIFALKLPMSLGGNPGMLILLIFLIPIIGVCLGLVILYLRREEPT